MSEPQGTGPDAGTLAHSGGEADPIRREGGGSDVGGPAATTESTAENALSDTSTVSHQDDPDDQATNPQ